MDNNKFAENLLKADGIDPANITESERAAFRQMLDVEQKRMKRLSWLSVGTLWIFVIALIGLCFSENLLEKLHIPFAVPVIALSTTMVIVMMKCLPAHNKKLEESNKKVSKLHYLVHGSHRGYALISRKGNQRIIHWPSLFILTVVLWVGMSLAGAGVYYIMCQRWIYASSSGAMWIHIFLTTVMPLSFLVGILRQGLKAPLEELVEIKSKPSKPGHRPNIWSIIMHSKMTKPIAVAIIIVVLIGIYQLTGSIDGASVAFGEVLKNSYKVQSFHALLNSHGDKSELWCKRGDKLRIEDIEPKDNEVTYQISNGPIMWDINQTKNRATKRPSRYFKQAQQKGVDVLDYFLRLQDTEGCSGFFAEEPVGQIEENGRVLNLYQTDLEQYGNTITFEAKVDARTNLLDYMKLDLIDAEGKLQSTELIVLGYDEPMPDEMFVFHPTQSMNITVREDEQVKQEIAQQADGTWLSGKIVWAGNGKPVSEARLTLSGGKTIRQDDGTSRSEYFKRVETDANGYWSAGDVPRGSLRISVRSWELDWPAVPKFTTNIGTAQSPAIIVDGQSEYENLDFEVYKPNDFFARITINVTDENGDPIEGVSGHLVYDDNNEMHGHIYANPKGKQFTGKDGRFDADNIWPTNKPVKLFLGTKGEFCATYATRYAQMKGFIIEPKGEYHFDITLPFVRQTLVQVVDTDGKPVKGAYVSAINRDGMPIFPVEWPSNLSEKLTDSNGMAEISGLTPGEEFLISVQRYDVENPDRWKPVTSALFHAIAPTDLSKPLKQVIFDERPITINGYCETEHQTYKGSVFLMVAGESGQFTMPYLMGKLDDSGEFKLQGVPAGHVRLLVRYRNTENEDVSVEGTIDTLPSNRYRVKVSKKQLEVVETKIER